MKIVHALGWYYPQHLGGTEVYVTGLSQRLQAAGHEVVVVAGLPGIAEARQYEYEGIPVYRFPLTENQTRAESQSRVVARGAEHFHQWLHEQKPDWVHFHSFTTGISIHEIRAARAAGAHTMATNHLPSMGYLCARGTLMRWGEKLCDGVCLPIKCAECLLQQHGLPKMAAGALARVGAMLPDSELPGRVGSALSMPNIIRHNLRLQCEILSLLDWLVVVNYWTAGAMIANGAPPGKVRVNYGGVSNLPTVALDDRVRSVGAPIKVGYFGRMVELKGVVELARAFVQLPRDLPLELEFRGPANHARELEILAQLQGMLGHDRRVTFPPPVKPQDAPQILAGYDVLCVPSVCFEMGPTVMLEAHAVGTPVIGTRVGAMAELIVDGVNGRLVSPGDVDALAAALFEVATHPAETLDRWRLALPVTRTMDDIAKDYLKLYTGE